MSAHLQRAMAQLNQKVLTLGAMVEEAIAQAVNALTGRDGELAARIIEADDNIDRFEIEVEEECLKLLALYQPLARDLRQVVAVLKMNNDLERLGDLAANIAKRARVLAGKPQPAIVIDYNAMAVLARTMVKQALDALVNGDAELAEKVCGEDDRLDAMRRESLARLQEEMQSQPEHTEALMALSSVARHLERIGDMATNIAEDVIYMVRGEIARHRGLDFSDG